MGCNLCKGNLTEYIVNDEENEEKRLIINPVDVEAVVKNFEILVTVIEFYKQMGELLEINNCIKD